MSDDPTGPPRRPATRKRKPKKKKTAKRAKDEFRGKLRPHDPFELIRWLALSQPDPRKALAELVQNSLDADAKKIHITRRREKKMPCLFIFDDGDGVIPEMDRPEALKYIATHVGHSRKRSLSPQERMQLMTQGQYGIGLLGFWSLGETLEMRTAVPGQRPHRLVLHRDRADYRIEPLRGRLALDEKFTEIVIVGLHPEAQTALLGRKAADYLASELRGQLLARSVDMVVEDRMSRGRAQKVIAVRPRRFLGERLEGIGPVEVPGHAPIRFEIYLSGNSGTDDGETGLAVYSAGTLVAESFNELSALGLDREPWTDSRLSGIVDYSAFRVAPGSRRGVVVNEAAGAFARALAPVEPILMGVLDAIERQRIEELDKSMVRDLQRAFRDFYRQRPRYSLLPVETDSAGTGAGADGSAEGVGVSAGPGVQSEEGSSTPAGSVSRSRIAIDLLPPGPLNAVKVTPSIVRIACGARRVVRAQGLDATGRPVDGRVEYEWSLSAPVGTLSPDDEHPERTVLEAGDREALAQLTCVARAAGHEARAEVEVEVLDAVLTGRGDEGIPEPELVHLPGTLWRSRMQDGRWQVNIGHRDFRAVVERPALKLRYLAMLFAKEVVLRSHQDPRFEQPLEQLIEIASYADLKLTKPAPKRKPRRKTEG